MIKPYIFMVLLPATLVWVFYLRVLRLRNALVKFVLIPILGSALVALSIFVLQRMGDQLDKFALDDALKTIQSTSGDLSNQLNYGSNSFQLGEFDGTWLGVVKKFPVAVNAALFRPYLWESKSVVVAISGLENLFVMGLTLFVLLRAGPRFVLRCIGSNPLLLMSVVFSLLFAFTVGVTTPNFGALVRFKIPMVPFYISSLFIIDHLTKFRRMYQQGIAVRPSAITHGHGAPGPGEEWGIAGAEGPGPAPYGVAAMMCLMTDMDFR
ncbi:MAG: hypothetical protein IPN44_08850 [Flavobacteriales bacterium]|nr:hypothetical protein [Flavobacteriales bacterium]